MTVADLIAEAVAIDILKADVIEGDIAAHAMEYVVNGWEVGPLCERDPDDPRVIKGPYGKAPHPRLTHRGVLDFTNDVGRIAVWWGSGIPWNIGLRPPESVLVLDVESIEGHGKDGLAALARLEAKWGPLPPCPTVITGSGGKHFYLRRPLGKLSMARLPDGIEYKTHSGYVVAPPSIHPNTSRPYVWA